MRVVIFYINFLLVLSTCSVFGQSAANKSEVIKPIFVNDSGEIVIYSRSIQSEREYVVHNLKTNNKNTLRNIQQRMLLTDNMGVFYNLQQNELYFLDFKTNSSKTIKYVMNVEFVEPLQTIVYKNKVTNELITISLKNNKTSILGIPKYHFVDVDMQRVFFQGFDNELHILDLSNSKQQKYFIADLDNLKIKKLKWDKKADNAYLFAIDNKKLDVYELGRESKKIGDYLLKNDKEQFVIDTLFNEVHLLPTGHIALGVKQIKKNEDINPNVVIWNGTVNGFPPLRDRFMNYQKQLILLDLKKGGFTSLMKCNNVMGYNIDSSGAIYRFEILENDNSSKLDSPITYYKYSFDENKFHYFKTFSGKKSNLIQYQEFPHFVYFEDNNWFYYDGKLKKAIDITSNSGGGFYDEEREYYKITGEESLSPPVIWEQDGFYLNDKEDIWFYDWDREAISRVTNGKLKNKNYKIADCNINIKNHSLASLELEAVSDKYLVLTWSSGLMEFEGIDLLLENNKIKNVTSDKAHYSKIKKINNNLLYVKEKVNAPPAIYLYNIKKEKEVLIYQSNDWDIQSAQIKSEHFYWYKDKNTKRGALVRFPKNYKINDTIKYPVIVNVYEKKFKIQNKYIEPDAPSFADINFRNFTEDDYFVIEPDIYYEVGEPGFSALNCVNDAIDFLATQFPLDTLNMGIYGHSFGGYETNFIITQTPRFKTAISNAGVADVVSTYLNYSFEYNRPDSWRFETQQWRMGKSFFDDQEMYIKNSPIYHAKSINTPLLLITGNEDYVVNWQQSLYMFSALKRLNKEVYLLNYNQEGHSFGKYENKIDVSDKTKQWFDFYLKNKEKPIWMK